MKTTMILGGIGPRLALMCLPYIALSLVLMARYPEFMNLSVLDSIIARTAGYAWLVLGVAFWTYSAVTFLKGFSNGRLITWGPYAICRNPIYASMIVFMIPALALIFHSGLLFSVAIVLYIGFKLSIHGEKIILRRTFHEAYDIYESSVNELIPLPPFFKRKLSFARR
jgi:protein-S-isoprenylcysteine O-methyltransferase Ste14